MTILVSGYYQGAVSVTTVPDFSNLKVCQAAGNAWLANLDTITVAHFYPKAVCVKMMAGLP